MRRLSATALGVTVSRCAWGGAGVALAAWAGKAVMYNGSFPGAYGFIYGTEYSTLIRLSIIISEQRIHKVHANFYLAALRIPTS